MKKIIIWAIVVLLIGLSAKHFYEKVKYSPGNSFKTWIIEDLESLWHSYLLDAVDSYLQSDSERYSMSIIDFLKVEDDQKAKDYDTIMQSWKDYLSSTGNPLHDDLVKKVMLLHQSQHAKREVREKELKNKLNEIFKLSKSDANETEDKVQAVINDKNKKKYELCINMLERHKYNDIWYRTYEIDDDLVINDIAVLKIYLTDLPDLIVYFFRSMEGGWRPFYSYIDFDNYFIFKRIHEDK